MAVGDNCYNSSSYSWGSNITNDADLAESVLVLSWVKMADVVVIDAGSNFVVKRTNKPYDLKVAGVISSNPGLRIGKSKTKGYRLLALSGQIPCKVTISNGRIKPGDMLVSLLRYEPYRRRRHTLRQ